MSIDLFTVRFGAPAVATLAAVVGVHQAGDPFAPVTVLVPDNLTGVTARRELAAVRGVVNVSFCTPAALAALLAPASGPVASPVVLGAAARDVLAAQTSGLFAAVAPHPATETALVGAHLELAAAAPDTLAALEATGSRRTRAVVDLHRRVRARLRSGPVPRTDEHEIARAATAAVEAGTAPLARVGSVVVHLVDRLAPAHLALVRALGTVADVTVLVGVTGVADADVPLQWWLDALDRPDHPAINVPPAEAAIEVFRTSDSDEEVRHVVRDLLARVAAGTPLDRCAIVHPGVEPYPRLVHEHLAAAGIAHNGPAVQRLADTVAGRVTTALVALVDAGDLRRRDVLDLAAIAPGVDDTGADRPVAAWDSCSRALGVIGGLEDWRRKLGAAGRGHDPAVVAGLAAFVEALAGDVVLAREAGSWPALAAWLHAAVERLVGRREPDRWPAEEARAVDDVLRVVDQFAALGPYDRRPGVGGLGRAVATALDVAASRLGVLGVGVQTGPLEHLRARTADVVYVLGLAEGLCPAPPRDDTLLPDDERRLARHGELALATSRVGEQHRSLLLARAAATQLCVLGSPRGDHRGGRTRLPSRWLLDAVGECTGVRPTSDALDTLEHPAVHHVASFVAGLATAAEPVHLAERRLRVLYDAGPAWRSAPALVPTLARGVDAIDARRSAAFTAWDGNLAGCAVPSPAGGEVLSATRLESYAACPARYLFASLLGLRERTTPEELDDLDPRERGLLLHVVLERFVAEVLARPAAERPAPGAPWTATDAARLHELATEEFAAAEARGVTGPAVVWRLRQYDLRRALDEWLVHDHEAREAHRSVPEAVELAFGLDGRPPLTVALDEHRSLAFRGRIDRVDRAADGSVVVYDYKSGKPDKYRAVLTDPVAQGTRLQLPLYGLAAAAACDAPTAHASYWFVERAGRQPFIGYPLDDDRLARARDVLGVIVDGIEHGVFPARPGADNAFFGTHDNCAYCDFDRICPRARGDRWVAKTAEPSSEVLAAYVHLTEPAS